MEILIPKFGLFFWSAIIFLIFYLLLRKYAWKPILSALKQREETIEHSILEAKRAREEMTQLKSDNEALIKEARVERERIIKEANAQREKIVSEARNVAQEVERKIKEQTMMEIEAERAKAVANIKEVAATLAVEVAEKILRGQLANPKEQSALAQKMIEEMNGN